MPVMELSTITYEARDGVAHVRFARPEGANAVNPQFSRDLLAVMIEIEFDSAVKAVSVTAEGKVFCAGGDLKEFNAAGDALPRLANEMLVDFHGAIYKMNRIPKPFVAGVRGAAGGAGLSIMSAFDLVVSAESAKYTMAYTRAGVTPDGTSTYFVARHIGLRRMLDLTLTNRVLTAQEAESWGLVNRVVPDDEVDATVAEIAQTARRRGIVGPWPRQTYSVHGLRECSRGSRRVGGHHNLHSHGPPRCPRGHRGIRREEAA